MLTKQMLCEYHDALDVELIDYSILQFHLGERQFLAQEIALTFVNRKVDRSFM